MTETPEQAAKRLTSEVLREGFVLQALHVYTSPAGEPLHWRIRAKNPHTGDKHIRPMKLNGAGYVLREPDYHGAKPLYRLHDLATRGSEIVYVTEGEWCADHLHARGVLATTSGSCDSARSTDWTPLAGRDVTIWPDYDEPGRRYAREVGATLAAMGCSVRLVDVVALDIPDKGDAVDWLALHGDATAGDILALPTLDIATVVESHEAQAVANVESGGASGWPEPDGLPALPPVAPFDYEALPVVLRTYVADIAERMQCPPDYVAASCIAMVGAAVGRRVGVRPKRVDDWMVVPNLWAMVVGRSGLMKSPAMSAALAPMRHMQDRAFKAHKEALRDHDTAVKFAKMRAEEAESRARKLVKDNRVADAQRILEAIAAEAAPAPPTARRYIVNDTTVEALAETLEENPEGVLVDRDELIGWLKALDKDGQQEARAFYLTAADGCTGFTTDRIGRGRGRHIEAVCVSVVGGIQPGVLAHYVRDTQRDGAGDDGMLQRFGLMVYPDAAKEWHCVDRAPDAAARHEVQSLIEHLVHLEPDMVGAHVEHEGIPYLRFDEEAQARFNEWLAALEARLRDDGDEHVAVISHLAKYRKLVPALALLNHLCTRDSGAISAGALDQAVRMAAYLESHARRVYSYASRPELEAAKLVMAKLRTGKLRSPFAARHLYRAGWSGVSSTEDANAAIKLLVDFGYVRAVVASPSQGRPRREFEAHPALLGTVRAASDEP